MNSLNELGADATSFCIIKGHIKIRVHEHHSLEYRIFIIHDIVRSCHVKITNIYVQEQLV